MKRLQPVLLVAAVSGLTLGLWLAAMALAFGFAEPFPRASHLAFAILVSIGTVVMLAVALRLEGAGPASLGLLRPGRGLAEGALWYGLPAAVGLAVAVLAGMLQLGLATTGDDALLKLLALAGLVLLSEALPEELIFRGLIQSRLMGLMGTWGGIVSQAVVFTVFAIILGVAPGPTDMGFIFFFGLVLGMLRTATGSLWASIGFHWLFMTVQQSYGAGWELLVVTTSQMVQMLVLTHVPFAMAIALLFNRVSAAKGGR